MKNLQKVFITGVTGNQGGAVAKNLLRTKVEVHGLSRNRNSDKSKKLEDLGVIMVEGDLNTPASYSSYLETMDTVFFVQGMEDGVKNEIKLGKMFIDRVADSKTNHLVYASVLGADLNTGVPHFESKNILEKYIKSRDIKYTILRPASFVENFLNPDVSKRIIKGKLIMPLKKDVVQQLISTEDIGKIAAQVILNPTNYQNKTISIATDEKRMDEMAESFSKELNKKIEYQKLPSIITWIVMNKDLRKMFNYMNKNNFSVVKDISSIKEEFPGLSNLNEWIATTFKKTI